jgi:anti-anti-sigma factor
MKVHVAMPADAPEINKLECLVYGADLTLDLSALTFIDSTGVQALIRAAENLHERGRLILRSPGKNVLRVFDLMRIDTAPNVQISQRDLPEGEGR